MTRARWGVVGTIVVLLALWEIVARVAGFDELLIATPREVASAVGDDRELLLNATWITAREALLGLALAVVFGFGAALVLHLSELLRDSLYPVLIGSQSLPTVVLAPLLVLLFGYGITPKVLIVALACFFPITVATLDGLRATDPDLLRLMRSLDARRLRTLWLVELPGAMPQFAVGLRMALTWAFVAAVFSEYVGAQGGLGYVIARGMPFFESGRVAAAVFILIAASLALWGLATWLERRLMPWAHRTQTEPTK